MKHLSALRTTMTRGIMATLAVLLCYQPVAYAIDTEFYSGNDILFYDPTKAPCNTAAPAVGEPLVGNDNAEKIFKYFLGKGLSGAQAAGFLGNMQQESGLNPAIIQGGAIASEGYSPVSGVGFGLVQWTFPDRQQPLVNLAKSTNRSITDIGLQMDYVWKELNGSWKTTLDKLKGVTDPVEAAIIVHDNYEISADTPAEVRAVRGGNATLYLEKYKDLAPSGDVSLSTPACDDEGKSNGAMDSFTVFDQCQLPWGDKLVESDTSRTFCQEGSAATALAMVVRNSVDNDVTPQNVLDYYNLQNLWNDDSPTAAINSLRKAASNWTLATDLMNPKDINNYKEVFDEGGIVIVAGSGAAPFRPQGHFIVIRGITEEGKFRIADPGDGGASEKDWDTAPILANAQATGGIALYKK